MLTTASYNYQSYLQFRWTGELSVLVIKTIALVTACEPLALWLAVLMTQSAVTVLNHLVSICLYVLCIYNCAQVSCLCYNG